MLSLQSSALMIIFSPLLAALVVGLGGGWIGRRLAHTLTIAAMTLSLSLSLWMFYQFIKITTNVIKQLKIIKGSDIV